MTNNPDPVSNGSNGKDSSGRFVAGNRYGRGNPHLARLAEAQAEARAAGTPEAVRSVLDKLHSLALAGDVAAAKAWLDRVLGRAESPPLELHHVGDMVAVGPPLPDAAALAIQLTKAREIVDEIKAARSKPPR